LYHHLLYLRIMQYPNLHENPPNFSHSLFLRNRWHEYPKLYLHTENAISNALMLQSLQMVVLREAAFTSWNASLEEFVIWASKNSLYHCICSFTVGTSIPKFTDKAIEGGSARNAISCFSWCVLAIRTWCLSFESCKFKCS
jgi:hypothetical protein